MKRMKWTLMVVLCLAMTFALAGCSGESTSADSNAKKQDTQAESQQKGSNESDSSKQEETSEKTSDSKSEKDAKTGDSQTYTAKKKKVKKLPMSPIPSVMPSF